MWSNGKLGKNVNAYNVVFRVVGTREDWDTSERMIREMSEKFWKWLGMMLELGVQPNIATFGMVMGLYQKDWNVEEAEFAFSEMRSFGITCQSACSAMISIYTRLSLLDKAEAQGKLEKAEQVLVSTQEAKFSPNTVACDILITGYGKVSNMFGVQWLFSGIQNSGLEPDETTYRSMIEGWGRVGNYKRQNEFIAYVKNPLADEVIKVLEDKRWNDPVFEDNLYRCLLICSCKELGHLENAVKIYTLMPKSDGRPNLHISCTMIDIYTTLGQFKEGEKLYQKLKSSGIALDVIAFSIVVRMYVKAGSLKDARSVLETTEREKDIIPDIICSGTCFAFTKSVEWWIINELSRLFNEMLQRGFNPNPISFNDMLHVYAKAELFNKDRELFMMARKRGVLTGLRECGLRPDLCSYNTLIKAYGIAGTVEDAVCLVKEMRQNGIEPDEITSTNLIAALQQNDKYLEAVKWSLWMKQRGL
ncbi:hypothetical protein POTOM_051120 [Populus tomentosa]|uniref:Pentatricopeptide repeat-containing protein n=1 Tax=Populus tomentosa TaxID=118781 RepID=A0A8X7Y122_POPTO|nr:hypothetical protein POTOM_051120 [Populus tomentosa]